MGFAAVQILTGITKLSELAIDVDKNWLTHLIKGLGDPVAAQDAATKTYVDTADLLRLLLSGGTMSGAIAMGTNKITGLGDPTLAQDAATRAYVLAQLASYLALAGGTMAGAIAMGTNKITGLGDPTADNDAANKKYIDDLIAGYSKVVWEDAAVEALFLDDVSADIAWTPLSLLAYTSAAAKVAIVQLAMSFVTVGTSDACDFYLRKTGTVGPLAAQLTGGYWHGDRVGGFKNSNFLIGLNASQQIDYKVDIIGGAVADLWINVEGYIE